MLMIVQVKPNLGHSEAASAITSIVKAVLSLETRTIIPNIKFENPSVSSKCQASHAQELF